MKKIFFSLLAVSMGAFIVLAALTFSHLHPVPETLNVQGQPLDKLQLLDRNHVPLTVTYQNRWNYHAYRPLYEIPETLQRLFVLAEDKRFYQHHGVDWWARWHAVMQNLLALRIVRGASTITEQTVRMLYPRPRTFWSRWVEGFEAMRLEQHFSKAEILEFYLNQVPYAHQRRGVAQAAQLYFDRDLSTLNLQEMIVLAILVRSPSRLSPYRNHPTLKPTVQRLAQRLLEQQLINTADYEAVVETPLSLQQSHLAVNASHFIHFLYADQRLPAQPTMAKLATTLDSTVQQRVQAIVAQRLQDLAPKQVNNAGVLVVDHRDNTILAWVNAHRSDTEAIDTITTPRQPGSTLKPFLYALALEKGWTAATLINDAPLAAAVGTGLHAYHNYSRQFYGLLRLRDALGNSLNTPAVRTVQFVGADTLLQRLRTVGIRSLEAHPDFYGDGLALGNGEVTLLELVQAYTVFAKQGQLQPLRAVLDQPTLPSQTIFNSETSSLIANILSDADARRLEFGSGALLRFPIQTAVKTGTSSDYHDAWAIGFNHRYTVGVWLGNLDQQPMHQVSGASGAALVLRAVFAELNRYQQHRPLYLSPKLVNVEICRDTGQRADGICPQRSEWFIAGTEPQTTSQTVPMVATASFDDVYLRHPSPDLRLALDPRIPDDKEAFQFELSPVTQPINKVEWWVNDELAGVSIADTRTFLWYLQRGEHMAHARVWLAEAETPIWTPTVRFFVR